MSNLFGLTVFKYDQLDERAQERAREWYREGALEGEWWEFIDEDAKTIGELMGISIDDIYWSGFSSQGDGACFVGSYSYPSAGVPVADVKAHAPKDKALHRIAQELEALQKAHAYGLAASIKHTGRDSHEYSVSIDVENTESEEDVPQDVEERVCEALRDFMRWIYKCLEAEAEYLCDDECVVEWIRANEYEFDEDGRRV